MNEETNPGDYTVSFPVSMKTIFEEIVGTLDTEMELPEGATAGAQPCAQRLAALVLEGLAKYNLLDGECRNIYLYSKEFL